MGNKKKLIRRIIAGALSCALCVTMAFPMAAAADSSGNSSNLVSNSGFEDGTTAGWSPRNAETLTAVNGTANTGSYSMLVSDRTANWNGASYSLLGKVSAGKTYDMSVYVKAAAGQSSSHTEKASLSVQRTDGDGEHYDSVDYEKTISENSWTKLSGRYTLSADGDLTDVDIYIESPDSTLEYYIDDASVTEVAMEPQPDLTSLCSVYKNDFDLGVAVSPEELSDSDPHSELVSLHFNSLTAGNAMKISSLQPTEGNFDFTQADKIVDYAIAHNMKIRGHNLLWHNQVPDWFFTDPDDSSKTATRDQLLARLKTHITTVLQHFKNKYGDKNPIYCWDVCNEVISDNHSNNGLRGSSENSKWLDIIGPDYIEKAFEYAHEADPSVKLYINDYNIEDNNQKTTDMYNEVKTLLTDGVPIDGIGLQMHIQNNYPSLSDIKASIEKLGSLGVALQVTELDCSTKGDTSDSALATQAERYKQLFKLFVSEKKYINSVTVWGISDDTSWLGIDNAPLLFDGQLKAKPAYYSVVTAMDSDSAISPSYTSFDKNEDKQADIPVTVTLNGNTLDGIYNGDTELVKGTDYTVSDDGSTVTILKSYLSQLAAGTAKLKFDFSKGIDPYLTVSVVDSTGGETPLPGVLKVETAFGSTASATNTISLHFRITNTSDTPIDLSAVKLRYYYTEDGTQAQNFWCDWCSAGTSNVTGAFNSISAENADNYLEVGFAGGTGNLAAGDSVEIQIRIAKEDWSNYNQTNDYSFNPAGTSYTEWPNVTAYYGSTQVYGSEPAVS